MAFQPLFRLGNPSRQGSVRSFLAFWMGGASAPAAAVVVETRRGGAFYPTQEELRQLRREAERRLREEKAKEARLEATIAEAYQDAVHPEIKAAKIAAARAEQERLEAEIRDLEDMHDMLTMYFAFKRTLH